MSLFEILGVAAIFVAGFAAGFALRHYAHKIPLLKEFFG